MSTATSAAAGWTNPLRDPRDKRLPRIAGPCGLVIFGVTGDLSRKKLMPAIYDLANRGLLPPGFALTGFARRDWADEDFGQVVYDAVKEHARTPFRQTVWDRLAEGFRFVHGTFDDDDAFDRLEQTVQDLDRERGTGGNHAFYLSIPPGAFPVVLQAARPLRAVDAGRRPVAPGGHREAVRARPAARPSSSTRSSTTSSPRTRCSASTTTSARRRCRTSWRCGSPTSCSSRSGTATTSTSVQITMAEDIGLGGRAGYYDGIGAARDVIQNHLLQLLAFTAMEEPVSFSSDELRAEKIKILNATKLVGPLDETTARGQYTGGWQGGELVRGLTEEEGFDPNSRTETFAAITCEVDTRRWAGVPFYLRTGKRLGRRVTEIAVIFKRAPHLPFDATMTEELGQNALVIRVQPDEGVTMRFGSKVPGSQMEVRDVTMDFGYGTAFTEASPEAYERLILDVLLGEPSLFPVNDEVERSWEILDPVIEHWARQEQGPDPYPAGSWGPESANAMLARTGRTWRRPWRRTAIMIVDLPSSTTSAVNSKLVELRESGGVLTLGRVLTLVIVTDDGGGHRGRDRRRQRRQPRAPVPGDRAGPRGAARRRRGWTRRSASAATPEPARSSCCAATAPLAAEEAGAGMVMPLLLPDAPVVAWWPGDAPAVPSEDPVGKLATAPDHRRAVGEEPDEGVRAAPGEATSPATPTSRGPGSRRGARCSPPRSTRRRTSRSPRRSWPARPSRRPPTCWPAGSRCGWTAR